MKENREPEDTSEIPVAGENHHQQVVICPADRKKWETGAQLVVPLAQLTMEESFSRTEGKLPWFSNCFAVTCRYLSYHVT